MVPAQNTVRQARQRNRPSGTGLTSVLICTLVVLYLLTNNNAQAAGTPLRPAHDDEVVQKLGPRVNVTAATPAQAIERARQALEIARTQGDPRYLGMAQAALGRWWADASAPVESQVLEATILQSRHEFSAARTVLQRLLSQHPGNPQAWLTLANLDKLQGRYRPAGEACEKLIRGPAEFYGLACRSEVQSHLGQFAQARSALTNLLQGRISPGQRAWLLSLIAENEERAGYPDAAARAYRTSLALDPEPYTAVAAADLHLRAANPQAALDALKPMVETDAVMLRRAHALVQLRDPGAAALVQSLRQRFAAADERGDALSAHARERVYLLLRLQAADASAGQSTLPNNSPLLALALTNLREQNESIDWQLAFEAAQASKDTAGLVKLRQRLADSGLRDARLQPWLSDRAGK